MLERLLASIAAFVSLATGALLTSPDGRSRVGPRRILVMAGFLPLFALVQLTHWAGFLIDEILFRGYRRVEIREPLFVLGVPRSGTTRLHQILAADQQFTTFTVWECLFGLSITQRRLWMGLGRIDGWLGRPLGRTIRWAERRIFAALDDVHPMTLTAPEEDYFALMPILACFILVLPFPFSERLWRMGTFDRDMPELEGKRILDFYTLCLKKHLYVHGPNKRLLSKNAAFASLAHALAARFPDARFIACLRDPRQTVPSQLSSIGPGLAFFGVPADSLPVRERFIDLLAFYYRNLGGLLQALPPGRAAWVTLPDIQAGVATALARVYRELRLPLSDDFAATLAAEDAHTRAYRSSHRYDLARFGLDDAAIRRRFANAHTHPALAAVLDELDPQGETQGDETARTEADASGPTVARAPGRGDAAPGTVSC